MSAAPDPTPPALPPAPRGPTLAEWAHLSTAEKDALEGQLAEAAEAYEQACWMALSQDERLAMAESEEHQDASYGSRQSLRAYFHKTGRSIYIASNQAVFYPGEPEFSPDLLAALDVPLRKRKSYVVAKEGKGLDLAVEVLLHGDRKKDLTENVHRYARLGISEYFVADLARRRIHAFHLEGPEARKYTPMLGAQGRYRSVVLGLDLTIEDDELRFYSGTAIVPLLGEETVRLAAQVERERERARAAEERAGAVEERARAAEERIRAVYTQALMDMLRLRALALTPEQEARIRTCQDSTVLQRWLSRAASASLEELFLDS
jgi:Uma2 family endonuclease